MVEAHYLDFVKEMREKARRILEQATNEWKM
jgi:hypothetical protein